MFKKIITSLFCIFSFSFCQAQTPTGEGCNSVYVYVDWLHWKAHEDLLQFAAESVTEGTRSTNQGQIGELNWEWANGYRIGAGYLWYGYRNWNFSLTYTNIKNRAENTLVKPSPIHLFNIWQQGLSQQTDFADARWRLHYQTLDGVIGTPFNISRMVIFEPNIGVRCAWTRESYDLQFGTVTPNTIFNQQVIKAVGSKMGFNTAWHICKGLRLIGDTAFSLLWTHYDVEATNTNRTPPISNDNLVDKFAAVRFVFEYRIGVGWGRSFCCDTLHAGIELAWEQVAWFRHNQLLKVTTRPGAPITIFQTDSDLSLYGLTLRGQLFY